RRARPWLWHALRAPAHHKQKPRNRNVVPDPGRKGRTIVRGPWASMPCPRSADLSAGFLEGQGQVLEERLLREGGGRAGGLGVFAGLLRPRIIIFAYIFILLLRRYTRNL